MQIGTTQRLKVIENNNSEFILSDEMQSENVFLSKIFVQEEIKINDELEVFVYQDDGRLKATTEIPIAEVGEFGVMTCVDSLPSGAFLDWGIIKDLFVPYKQQKTKMVVGKRYLVGVYLDELTGLITGTTKFKTNPQYKNLPFSIGEKVHLLLMGESDIGWNVVVNKKYIGLVYQSDVYKKLYPLSEEIGYIKNIREDGKIDVTLQPIGYQNIDKYCEKILAKLNENYGLLYLSDKSEPEEIKTQLQMSKKKFKKAIGNLYKLKQIEILEDKIKSI